MTVFSFIYHRASLRIIALCCDLRRSARTLLAAMGCPGDVAESVLGHMIPGVAGVYNRHQYDAERVEELAQPG